MSLDERNRLLSEMALPSSGDSGRGGAVLQERVRSLSSQAGLTVIGSEVREPTDLEDLIRLSVNAKLAGEPDALMNFFQSLDEQRPFLFVDSLSLTAQRNVPGSRARGAPGQEANVKFTAYDFVVYGGMKGTIEQIGADTLIDGSEEPYYEVTVRTDEVDFGPEQPIIPGMTVDVDILTGRKTVLSYLMKPVLRAQQRALSER